jgi:drug/metabolite transporter (DMT)-like permease
MAPGPAIGGMAWIALFYQTVIIAFASYLAWFRLLLTYPAARIAGFTFLAPVFGIVAGWALLGETLSWGLVLGVVAIGCGMRMINSRPAR